MGTSRKHMQAQASRLARGASRWLKYARVGLERGKPHHRAYLFKADRLAGIAVNLVEPVTPADGFRALLLTDRAEQAEGKGFKGEEDHQPRLKQAV